MEPNCESTGTAWKAEKYFAKWHLYSNLIFTWDFDNVRDETNAFS